MQNKISFKLKALACAVMVSAAAGVLIKNVQADTAPANGSFLEVPFTTQAPLGQWNDPRQKDGCEEASALMAYMWATGISYSPEDARNQIVGMSEFERYFYGYYEDSSAEDTAKLLTEYFGYADVLVKHNISLEDITVALNDGNIVITPINPRVISTKWYNKATTRHTVVVTGYDSAAQEIIVNDPLLAGGHSMRIAARVFESALADYASGAHLATGSREKSMIIVGRP